MDKYIVDYDLALKLKEIGFDEECRYWYSKDKGLHMNYINPDNGLKNCDVDNYSTAPLYDQVLSWFRDKDYYLVINVLKDIKGTFSFTVLQKANISTIGVQEIYTAWYIESYEEARNKGIEWIINHIKENEKVKS